MLLLYFAARIRRDRSYLRSFGERFGGIPHSHRTPPASVWLHAVSVGEVLSCQPLLKALKESYPALPVFVSCSTLAGRAIAEEKIRPMVDGSFYAPLDYVFCVRRVLRRIQPSLVIVMETEIWPNLYREAKRFGASLAVVNGRISDRAFPRYRRWAWFFSGVLPHVDALMAQSEEDRRRYLALGAPPERVEAAGNLKYDFNPGEGAIPDAIQRFLAEAAPRHLLIAASTMPPRDTEDVDEDDIVIAAFGELRDRFPGLLMILAPRRPERFDAAAEKLKQAGIAYVRRSSLPGDALPELPCVLLLDSMGELSRLFAIADVVFMGGTFPRRGGHNILEPAYFGKAVIAGPHMENFTAMAAEFTAEGALFRVQQPGELAGAVGRLLNGIEERNRIGGRARQLAEAKRGVTAKIAGKLMDLYLGTLPMGGGSRFLAPFALLWEVESSRRRALETARARKLPRPVISVGNITMGGSGKTPFADWLATELRLGGQQPAILTRGYRRRSSERIVVAAVGERVSPELTGDEPQIYLRRGAAHVGIGADRYEAGQRVLETLGADVFVLDDGFQHWRLARDLDIVLIDALDPFGNGKVFPRGRLREPLRALERARVFVITRCEPGIRTDPIEHVLRRYNQRAPILRSRVVPRGWIDIRTGRPVRQLPSRVVAAFCGLANPQSFWRTLESLNLEIRSRWTFGDHHHYRIPELRRFGYRARHAGARAVVITEKDIPNLNSHALELMAPLPIFALEIGFEVDDPGVLMEMAGRLHPVR